MVLHCVRPAASGGVNRLLDPELAYIALRDADPAHGAALMQPDAMTIPARTDDDGVARAGADRPGVSRRRRRQPAHALHGPHAQHRMGRPTPPPRAVAACRRCWPPVTVGVLRVRLEPGMGLARTTCCTTAAPSSTTRATRACCTARATSTVGAAQVVPA
jgi:hypothetical protein